MCRILVATNVGELIADVGYLNLLKAIATLADSGNTDACGFAAYTADGRWARVRAPVSCKVFALNMLAHKDSIRRELEDTVILLFHARRATGGDPWVNVNNHPFCTRDGLCLIHNGSVRYEAKLLPEGYDNVEAELGHPETDSAMLLAAVAVEARRSPESTLYELARLAWKGKFKGKASIALARPGELLYTKNRSADIYIYNYKRYFVAATAKDTLKVMGLSGEDYNEVTVYLRLDGGRMRRVVWDSDSLVEAGSYYGGYYSSYKF